MTPTQLRAFSAVVRLGSVKGAAAELQVTESAVSLNIGQLRKELGDQLLLRTPSGLALTPGGLRLARRAIELLGLQERTVQEVSQARQGRRLLRLAASSLFAEHAAPGLIQLFTSRAADLDVEMSVCRPNQFSDLLASRAVDLAIGPKPSALPVGTHYTPFLKYRVVVVAAPGHEPAREGDPGTLRSQMWLLGPSAIGPDGTVPQVLRLYGVPEERQRIFQSTAAALEETKRGNGVAPALSFTVADDVARGRLVLVADPGEAALGMWGSVTVPGHGLEAAAAELTRFVSTPRAIQAMLRGSGVGVGHFRPSVHVTLWS